MVLRVPSLVGEPGATIELRDVLLLSDGDTITVGSPTVPDAVVVAEVIDHGRGRKVVNFKFKAKVRYRRKRGHRQGYTAIRVQDILTGEAAKAPRPAAKKAEPEAVVEPAAEAPTPRRRARAAAAPTAETPAAPSVEREAAPAETPAPRRRRRTTAEQVEAEAEE